MASVNSPASEPQDAGAEPVASVKAPDSPLKRLLVQTSHYSLGSLLTMLAGLVTFPIMTRIFSVAEYGAMNLISATLTIGVALGKVGVQHSIIRYQSEIRSGKGTYTLPQFYATTLLGMATTGLIATAVLVVGTQLVPAGWIGQGAIRIPFAVASLVVIVQVVESTFINFIRADQLTALLMKYQVVKKYVGLALILSALFYLAKTLTAFYSATLLTEALSLVALIVFLLRRQSWPRLSRREFSRPLYRELLSFGIPMMIGYEMAGVILAVGDRYVIHGVIGDEPLGLYAAAYNLCQYVQSVVIVSVGQAVMPLYMQMWDRSGVEATSAFIARSLRTYVLAGAPIIAGLASVGPELLPSLASSKFASGAVILPWVIAGMVLDGGNSMLGAGLFIHRKTKRIMAIVLSCAILNILLNIVLVPRIGILGAAIATLISYMVNALSLAFAGRRLLPVKLPWSTMARAGAAAAVMYLALIHVCPGRRLLTVAVRIAVGGLLYAGLVTLVDPDARTLVRTARQRLRGKLAG